MPTSGETAKGLGVLRRARLSWEPPAPSPTRGERRGPLTFRPALMPAQSLAPGLRPQCPSSKKADQKLPPSSPWVYFSTRSPAGDLKAKRPVCLWVRALHEGTRVTEQAVPVSVAALSGPHPAGACKVKATYEKQGVRTRTTAESDK